MDVLEIIVTLRPKTEAGIRLRPKVLDWQAGRMTAITRWPDTISSNVQDVLPSLSMVAAWKSKYWATNRYGKLSIILPVLSEFGMKGYTGIRWLQRFVNYWRGHGRPLTIGIAQDIMRRDETVRPAHQLHHCMQRQGLRVGCHREQLIWSTAVVD